MENASSLATLRGLPIVVYDLEIKHAVDGKVVTWTSFDRMGISVGVAYDYRTGDFRVYFDDDIRELVDQLHSAKLIVGFNHIRFDNRLLRGTGLPLKPDSELQNYDIKVASQYAMGWRPGDKFPSGLKLDNHLEGMFGKAAMKTGDGALAPELFHQKKWGKLTSYCIADVRRTCMVFEHIWQHREVTTPVHGTCKILTPPQAMLGLP
jgi:DEAD/DEAH box helicase domain-containing protein